MGTKTIVTSDISDKELGDTGVIVRWVYPNSDWKESPGYLEMIDKRGHKIIKVKESEISFNLDELCLYFGKISSKFLST
jgi:hypothetical protein